MRALALNAVETVEQQQGGGDDWQRCEYWRFGSKVTKRHGEDIRARLMEVAVVIAMFVLRHRSGSRTRVWACDDRHRPMVE